MSLRISGSGVKVGQAFGLLTSSLLLLVNATFLYFQRSQNSLLLTISSFLFLSFVAYLNSKIYEIRFQDEKLILSNLLRKRKAFSIYEFDKITRYLTTGGIYKLHLKNGESFLFVASYNTQMRNLFSVDSNQIFKEIIDNIERYIQSQKKLN